MQIVVAGFKEHNTAIVHHVSVIYKLRGAYLLIDANAFGVWGYAGSSFSKFPKSLHVCTMLLWDVSWLASAEGPYRDTPGHRRRAAW